MEKINPSKVNSILATDCGSTTTKCILIEKKDDEYRLVARGEAPTTVEAPVEDVTRGVLNAVSEVQELVGRPILDGDRIMKPKKEDRGVDLYISTSSAGGGLQMMVAGVVKTMTCESAARAALGAGAIVMDSIATNDGRLAHEQIEKIRNLRPDMILLSGGIDGGTTKHVVKLAQIIAAADPRPRLGISYQLPVIYAGNIKAHDEVKRILGDKVSLDITENLRPILEEENLMPARQKIQVQFLEHVMAQAPGYKKLMAWTDVDIMPTPGAVGAIIQRISDRDNITVVGVDIGGATTDVFSVFKDADLNSIFNRSVSANLGMSYSISNVVSEAGMENIMRWLPFDLDEREIRNRVKNKMIRPTSIPYLLQALVFEQAVAREALRLSFIQHKSLAVGLKGIQQSRTISDVFSQKTGGETLVDMIGLDIIIGSGGVLSHAPRNVQTAIMMIDSFFPEGITMLAKDSIFMMPQLGVLAQVHPEAATQVFEKDCLIMFGTCVAPVGVDKDGKKCISISFTRKDGTTFQQDYKTGELNIIPMAEGEEVTAIIKPVRKFDIGAGRGIELETTLKGGSVGVIVDTRCRPINVPKGKTARIEKLFQWYQSTNMYDISRLKSI